MLLAAGNESGVARTIKNKILKMDPSGRLHFDLMTVSNQGQGVFYPSILMILFL